MSDPIINELLIRLNELKESSLEHPAPDFASYREQVGRYNGLKEAIQIITSIYSQDE